jgi:peptidoglycan/xylan/chitin deacetylase (PgdA/CDA1 family)
MMPVKSRLLAWYFSVLSYLQNRRGIIVLMYHSVRDDMPPSSLVVPIKIFRQQMDYLKNYCDVIKVKDMCEYYSNGRPLPMGRRPQVVITLDDECKDNYLNAFPILKEFNLPAAIFLISDFIGTNKTMNRHSQFGRASMLSWEDVQTMQKSGLMTFLAHTQTHPNLTQISYADQKAEIANSIKTVSERLSQEAAKSIFCYTYGKYNHDTLRILKELGIKIAFTVEHGINTGEENPLELKRICADGSRPLFEFMRLLNPLPHGIQYRLKIKMALRRIIPDGLVRRFKILQYRQNYVPTVGKIHFGDLRRVLPLSNDFGYMRGGPIDRYYIEKFLSEHSADIKGVVLEVGDNKYTLAYGKDRIIKSDILDINRGNKKATIIADLTNAIQLPSNTYDCIIFTHVISMIYDCKATLRTIYRMLKPSGALLLTSGVGFKMHKNPNCDIHWNISDICFKKILSEIFSPAQITAQRYGNVLTMTSFLFGIGRTELDDDEYNFNDMDYPVIFGIRAIKD